MWILPTLQMAKIDINFIFENDFTCLFVLYGMKSIKLNVFNNIGIVESFSKHIYQNFHFLCKNTLIKTILS